jgi:hypothetical protein
MRDRPLCRTCECYDTSPPSDARRPAADAAAYEYSFWMNFAIVCSWMFDVPSYIAPCVHVSTCSHTVPCRTHDLRVPPELLDPRLAREADAAGPLDRAAGHALRALARVQLRGRGLARERQAGVLAARGVVREQAGRVDVDGRARELVLHALERADGLAELLALVRVRHGLGERALREPDHLRRDADAPCTPRVSAQPEGARRARAAPSFRISIAIL